MRLFIIYLTLGSLLLVTTSEKVGSKSLKSFIERSQLIIIVEVCEANHKVVRFSTTETIISKKNKSRRHYKLCIRNIHQGYKLPGKDGKYLLLSEKDHASLNNKSILCVFRIVDNKILITNPFLTSLHECGLISEPNIHEAYRVPNAKNNISDGVGVLVELEEFLRIIQKIEGTVN